MGLDQPRQDVVAKVVTAAPVVGVEPELLEEEVGREAVDAHRGQRLAGIGRIRRRVGHLLAEAAHAARAVHGHRAKLGGLDAGDRQRGHGHVGAALLVGGDQCLVVHLVDVVAGEHDHEPRGRLFQRIDVLVDRVGGAQIPVLVDPLLRGQHVEKLADVAAEEPVPTEVQVAVEAAALVLREQQQPLEAAVETVGEREVDDPVTASEWHGRLGAVAGQRIEPNATASSKHHGHHIPQPAGIDIVRPHQLIPPRFGRPGKRP